MSASTQAWNRRSGPFPAWIGGLCPYHSTHWAELNVLAHVRFSEFPGQKETRFGMASMTEEKPVLFIEEIQSDWHQQGREKGYIEPGRKDATVEAFEKAERELQAYAGFP